jgi:hypothetical protein
MLGFGDGLSHTASALTAVGLVGVVGIIVLSFGFNIPLPVGSPPPEFDQVLARWTRFHLMRTAFRLTGAAAFTVAALPGVA